MRVLSPSHTSRDLPPSAQAGLMGEATHEHYVGLLCRFAPHDVLEYLQVPPPTTVPADPLLRPVAT